MELEKWLKVAAKSCDVNQLFIARTIDNNKAFYSVQYALV